MPRSTPRATTIIGMITAMAIVAAELRPPDPPPPDALNAVGEREVEVSVLVVASEAGGVSVTTSAVDVIVITVGP